MFLLGKNEEKQEGKNKNNRANENWSRSSLDWLNLILIIGKGYMFKNKTCIVNMYSDDPQMISYIGFLTVSELRCSWS